MAKELRIYPGIGFARLGDHPDSFFLSPEVPGLGPLEPTSDGTFTPVSSFRADGGVRRQGARFRVFEVETNANGEVTDYREVTSDQATVEWRVELANQKSAAGWFISETNIENAPTPRNPGIPEADLQITPSFPIISGKDKRVVATQAGKFKNSEVFLGELRTDEKGRLIVLGGHGISQSVPPNMQVGTGPEQNAFANNEFWCDDIADGPVSASVTFPGSPAIEAVGAWVIVAPPDFAPKTRAITTLYDVAFDAAIKNGWISAPAVPSYKSDIFPILQSIEGYRWTSRFSFWEQFPRNWSDLGLKSNTQQRQKARQGVEDAASGQILNFYLTDTQNDLLDRWRDGDFVEDYGVPDAMPTILPSGLDRASMTQAVGGGFYPGIEAGIVMTYRELYVGPFRVRRDSFAHSGRNFTPSAGFITRNMACPWQADFIKCAEEQNRVWWPAQRPINVRKSDSPSTKLDWSRGINSHRDLVDHAMQLGFVTRTIAGSEGVFETDRILGEV